MTRVLIVDDHPMVRAGLIELVDSVADFEVVGFACDGQEAIEATARLRPDVVLMDLTMPVLDGVAATEAIKAACGDSVQIIVLTTFHHHDLVSNALVAGASGYLLKDVDPSVLIASVRSVLTGGMPLSPAVASQLLSGRPQPVGQPGGLTVREQEILRLVSEGCSNKQVARALGISEKTVKTHCGRIFQRLGVRDRTQAALWAARNLPSPTHISA